MDGETEETEEAGVQLEFVTDELEPPADGIFPVDAQWSLEWDEVEKDSETTQYIRENPDEWVSGRNWDSAGHLPPRTGLPLGGSIGPKKQRGVARA